MWPRTQDSTTHLPATHDTSATWGIAVQSRPALAPGSGKAHPPQDSTSDRVSRHSKPNLLPGRAQADRPASQSRWLAIWRRRRRVGLPHALPSARQVGASPALHSKKPPPHSKAQVSVLQMGVELSGYSHADVWVATFAAARGPTMALRLMLGRTVPSKLLTVLRTPTLAARPTLRSATDSGVSIPASVHRQRLMNQPCIPATRKPDSNNLRDQGIAYSCQSSGHKGPQDASNDQVTQAIESGRVTEPIDRPREVDIDKSTASTFD